MESKVKDGNYVTIQSWMVKDLNLKGNELLVYAIIYMFSQDGKSKFVGSRQYIADWCNSTKQGIDKCLSSLLKKNLIKKEVLSNNGVNFVNYWTTELCGVDNKVDIVDNKVDGGSQQSCHHNKEHIKEDIKDNNKVIKKEIIKEKNDLPFINKETMDSYQIYKEMRRKMRKPIVDDMKVFERLMKLSNGNENVMKEILDQSVANGWQGLFELKDKPKGTDIDWMAIYGNGEI